jgi:DNA polymerase-4
LLRYAGPEPLERNNPAQRNRLGTTLATAMAKWILHVDVDQFLVAVELRRRPDLRGRPVVVGGSGDQTQPRMVAASASYEARARGVHAGMPLRTAARICPDAVFLPSDNPAYDAASVEVMDALRQFPVVVEVWGWDEAALGADTDDPEALAADLRAAVREATGLECSIGIGDNKLRAKTATGLAKPAGVYRLTEDSWLDVMGDRPTTALTGIGGKTARKLADLGVTTVRELAAADVHALQAKFGPTMGAWYVLLGRGVGSTEVTAEPWVARSRSRQRTFARDLTDRADVSRELTAIAHEVAADVLTEDRDARRVAIIVRFASFFTITRSATLPAPTRDPGAITAAAIDLLERLDPHRPVRLLGVRAELTPPAAAR